MVAVNLVKYRGFYSLSRDSKAELLDAVSCGVPVDIACEAAGIVKDTFYRWMRAGKALHLGQECEDIPHFLPRQPDEPDEEWDHRSWLFARDCAEVEDIFLTVRQTRARALVTAGKKMWNRVLNDDEMYSNAWFLERTAPEHYSLVTTNRKEIEVRAEVTHKHQAELLAEAFALLGPANPALTAGPNTITVPEGDAVVTDPDHD